MGEGGQRGRGLPVSAIVTSCWLSHSQESPEGKNNGNVGNDVGLLALGELGACLPGADFLTPSEVWSRWSGPVWVPSDTSVSFMFGHCPRFVACIRIVP